MPSQQEVITLCSNPSLGADEKASELKYFQEVNHDPRLLLAMKVLVVKRKVGRAKSGSVGKLALTYQGNTECSDEEWATVKENWPLVLQLEAEFGK
jgi:hypothetical protein